MLSQGTVCFLLQSPSPMQQSLAPAALQPPGSTVLHSLHLSLPSQLLPCDAQEQELGAVHHGLRN